MKAGAYMLLGLLCVSAGACGGSDDEAPDSPAKVVRRYHAAAQDPKARCDTLSDSVANQFGSREQCAERTIPSADPAPPMRVERVVVEGDDACVRIQVSRGGSQIIYLGKEEGEWRIDGFDSGLEAIHPRATPCRKLGPRRD